MTETEIKSMVCELFLGGDAGFPIDDDTDLLEAGICDSLGLVQMAGELQARVPGLRILDQEVDRAHLGSIAAIRRLLAQRVGA